MLKNKSNCDSAIMIILFKNRSREDTGILDVVATLEVFLGKPEIIHYLFPNTKMLLYPLIYQEIVKYIVIES